MAVIIPPAAELEIVGLTPVVYPLPVFYLRIIPLNDEPLDMKPGEDNRHRFVFSVSAMKYPSETFVEELMAIIRDGGGGTVNADLYGGSNARLPTGDGPYTTVVSTGGAAGLKTHNEVRPAIERPTALITVRATDPIAAKARARVAHSALAAVVNQTVTPVTP